MKLQDYKNGSIHKTSGKYWFKSSKGESVGSFETVDKLVKSTRVKTLTGSKKKVAPPEES